MKKYKLTYGFKDVNGNEIIETKITVDENDKNAKWRAGYLATDLFRKQGHFTLEQYIEKYVDEDVATEKFIDDRQPFLVVKFEEITG